MDVRDVDLPVGGRSTGRQVEIAVVQEPVPGDGKERSAHQPFHRGGIEAFRERFQIPFVISRPKQPRPETPQRYVRERVEVVERDPPFPQQVGPEFPFGGTSWEPGRNAPTGLETRSSSSPVPSTPYPAAFNFFSTAIAASVTPAPRWASAWDGFVEGKEATRTTRWATQRARSASHAAPLTAERFVRSISRGASGASPSTRKGRSGTSSGAPPVTSRTWNGNRRANATTAAIVSRDMISTLPGPASRWQCRQRRLHRYPVFTWRVVISPRTRESPWRSRATANGSTPTASPTPVSIPGTISLLPATMPSVTSIPSPAYMESFSAIFRICTPCTRDAPPRIAAATWTASVISARFDPFSRDARVYASMQ